METKTILIAACAMALSIPVWGQRKVYQNNPAKGVTDKIGVTLTESRVGFVYERKSSDYLVPYVSLKFKNNIRIEKKRYTGSLCYRVKRNGEVIFSKYMWGTTIHPGVNTFYLTIIDSDCRLPDDNYEGCTVECFLAESKDWKANNTERIYPLGEFKIQKINFKLTWREDFVYYTGSALKKIDVPFEKL